MSFASIASQRRNELRRAFKEKRRCVSQSERTSQALKLVEQAKRHQLFTNAKRIAVYFPHDGELDTLPLIQYLWSLGKSVYLPVLHPFCDGHLLFLEYQTHTTMTVNDYGIAEPKLNVRHVCPLQSLDIVFTPLVAFDDDGNRLGMGGGFYDRTLKTLQQHQRTDVIGLAYDLQKTLSLPIEPWDIPLPKILTPTTLYQF